ncbi:baseplate multidomain protein megatron [Brevundimonas variabilis]|uniref:Uncharacterized protein n=1 Tax=Brevundimonas variabilis TaxID=74312 RepID=A0A7W9CJW0_9CAUL|nr:glycoside hydrolase/phage tail family protein [Brevundimonas variabilis]MBB5746896.1 hypothetical protein [Brevundimonas variabilis]
MAQVILSAIGGQVGGPVGRAIGGLVGQSVDNAVIGALGPARQRGPRLETLRVQSSADGAPMAFALGRARVTGQLIWAARFLERRREQGGGKGGPRTVDHAYSLSFAVAICEGPIDGIGRVWADGQPLDLRGVTMRVHRGTEDQMPDPLIEAVEGQAPAFRGTACAVFEDMALAPFGNRVPQLSFEVFRRPGGDGLEERLEGVCLIPGAGEFVLATETVLRRDGLTRTTAENVHHPEGRPDLIVSLDQLEAQAPNLKRVSLVIGWFGDDLRAGHCRVRPGVERRDKVTEPQTWSVAGLDRRDAHRISTVDGRPAYGGTPSDASVRQAVAALKARGWAVTLYPFVFMDVAAGNGLPDPYGGAEQAAYPWRGRVRGADGAGAASEMAALFGTADGWGLRRLALHYARLAAETGCDGLLIGSEMRGVTWTRDAQGGHPAVAQYRQLAAECRAIVGPDVALSYAADWSEYFGFQPGDGTVTFHLDPLWADPQIDHVGIDWYPPMGDWRDGEGGVDAVFHAGPDAPAYLASQIAGGEGFDWYYASDTDRAAQVRTPIVDTAHGEHWVFRPKDLVGWWSHAHHDRPGGVRSSVPTAWVPGMKPIRLTEFGCAAVDRGGNAPNLFVDPKSSESFLPPFSSGARDDRMQRKALEAVLGHFAEPDHNPVSAVYGGRMLAGADAWCWDARPFPAFPALADVWADAGAWAAGHWLNGRLGGDGDGLLSAILRRGGLGEDQFTIGAQAGAVQGYVIDRPMRTRDALEPLLAAFGMVGAERDGKVALVGVEPVSMVLEMEALALPDEGAAVTAERTLEARPGAARVRFIDEGAGYQTGSVVLRSGGEGGGLDVDLPAVCGPGLATALAERMLAGADAERLTVALGPLEALRLEAGDRVAVEDRDGVWRVERVDLDETPRAVLAPVIDVAVGDLAVDWALGEPPRTVGRPVFHVLDLPPLPGFEDDDRPLVAVAAEPWVPMAVWAGPDAETLTERAVVERPATLGALVESLGPGVVDRWDTVNSVAVRVEGQASASLTERAVLGGANALAVETVAGWEVVQFQSATLIGEGIWRLDRLLRGQQGTDAQMRAGSGVGAAVVFLDAAVERVRLARGERGLERVWRAGPAGMAPGGAGFSERVETVHGVHDRGWSPVHLRVAEEAEGVRVSWIPRVRIHGDGWDREAVPLDGMRFRVRVLVGDEVRRVAEVDGTAWVYPAAMMAEDGLEASDGRVRVAVAPWSSGFGWGSEGEVSLQADRDRGEETPA